MKILLDGYLDCNFGDDLMLSLARDGLSEHEVFTDKARSADIYLKVTGSGFLIHNNAGILYRLRDMRREKRYAPKRAVLNCNISPFINKAAEKVILKQLQSYDFITVRDKFSYEYIKKNIPEADCKKYPDMVFSLPERFIPDTPCENLLGIAVHNSMDFVKTARLADGYIEETGQGTLLLCFDAGLENDLLAAEKIFDNMKRKNGAEIVLYENIPDMLSHLKRCQCILGARLHSIILAVRMGIPFVPLAYSDKTINALDEAGCKNKVYNAADFDVAAALQSLLNPEPYELDKRIIADAQNHISSLNEFLKQQI